MRHHYVGPRPITKELYSDWLRKNLEAGRISNSSPLKTGVSTFKTGESIPWVEDDQPEPEKGVSLLPASNGLQ